MAHYHSFIVQKCSKYFIVNVVSSSDMCCDMADITSNRTYKFPANVSKSLNKHPLIVKQKTDIGHYPPNIVIKPERSKVCIFPSNAPYNFSLKVLTFVCLVGYGIDIFGYGRQRPYDVVVHVFSYTYARSMMSVVYMRSM